MTAGWRCLEGPDEWAVHLQLPRRPRTTVYSPTTAGLGRPFLAHCSTKWAYFLLGVKAMFEEAGRRLSPVISRSAAGVEPRRRLGRGRGLPALADPGRRTLLDSLHARNGQNLASSAPSSTWPASR
jgi:hypothetical protein